MPIEDSERQRMMRAKSIGPRMIGYLEEIGIERLDELKTAEAEDLASRINATLGRRHINRTGIHALENLIAYAKSFDC
ncbi:hypothetical protein LAC81_14510 [Ensifer adhaerens]|uniref:hypothetical protein n=1 Tax=Ensifer adhaerens TaxID=106592 RepID=UPI001CBFD761|nr:hypothetical protein [Ensifer adhaerens]MBZ7923001.1 hypothetical protein [Ensifer adhaerens]UAX91596.1 hypothetical protein LAC78_14505 [Ensifer adhaerens]UAX99224.1 hypothetical protein LAC80_14510 [Ensifer adhaerens]UAY06607.1 hypothetical protein LAC81_14510 [Ensifer adhaerens]